MKPPLPANLVEVCYQHISSFRPINLSTYYRHLKEIKETTGKKTITLADYANHFDFDLATVVNHVNNSFKTNITI